MKIATYSNKIDKFVKIKKENNITVKYDICEANMEYLLPYGVSILII